MSRSDVPDLLELVGDEAIKEFTMVPTAAGESFVRSWIRGYEDGWRTGTRAGFVARTGDGDTFLGFGSLFKLDLPAAEAEIGYAVAPAARGQGIAGRTLALLTAWGLDGLGLERLELRIAVTNPASEHVAARAGYTQEGVLRHVHFKEGRRVDLGVWSRLRSDGQDDAIV
jgi:RimJ/RimL family protein N-acetyltransferase